MFVVMAQMPALIPKEVEIQRLKKIWLIVIAMGSTAASVEVDNFVDGSLHQTSIRDSAFTPAQDRKSTRLNSSHSQQSRMPSSA